MSKATLQEVKNMHRTQYNSGSDGECQGYDLKFEFRGVRYCYFCAYDRYVLVIDSYPRLEVYRDGKTGLWWENGYRFQDMVRLTKEQADEMGLALTHNGAYHYATRPHTKDESDLSEIRNLLHTVPSQE